MNALLLLLSQAAGNTAVVNQAATQRAKLVASGSDYVGQPLEQAGTTSSSSSVLSTSSSSSSSSVLLLPSTSLNSNLNINLANNPQSATPTSLPPPPPPPSPSISSMPPVANAGGKVVDGGSTITLDGSTSFRPANDPITFAWTQTAGPTVTLNGATSAKATFTAPTNLQSDTAIQWTLWRRAS